MSEPRLFTVPPGAPFLPVLAEALVSGRLVGEVGSDPLGLAAVTVYLPTRRVARAFGAVLAARLGHAALLPRMIPLGEADEAELDLAASPLVGEGPDVLAPSMPPLERRLVLAALTRRWAETIDRALLPIADGVPFGVPASPADAVALAGDLESLMDALTVEGVPWDEIAGAVDSEYSRYFGLTLDFLRIAAENWPRLLAERSLGDPVFRARRLVTAEVERLRRAPPGDPVVIAGATGSTPAVADLIGAIAALPRGAAVLPGLDRDLDDAGWNAIETDGETAHGHPQAILHRLLGSRHLGRTRASVIPLGEVPPEARARDRLLSEALRPAATTDAWARIDPAERDALAASGLAGLAVVEAADEREEALVAAVALRETLERPGATAAFVTPDRGLAARVAAELGRWGIVAEDAAGQPLPVTLAGRFARLAAELAVELRAARIGNRQAERLIALLAHPMTRLGLPRGDVARAAAALEIGVLRGPALSPGFPVLRDALGAARSPTAHVPRAKRRLTDLDWDLAAGLIDRLEAAFAGFPGPCDPDDCDLLGLSQAHRAACEALLEGPADDAEAAADASLDGLDTLFDDLASAESGPMRGALADYPAFFTGLAGLRSVTNAGGAPHPRIAILGLTEARLISADRVVLGGLDEGVWPMKTVTDAFLNRPMRVRIGLDPPERRIGQSAHDFVALLGHRDAVVTRAVKRGGSPMVRSRFLLRMQAFCGDARWRGALDAGRRLAACAAALDRGTDGPQPRLARPAPKPDPALFPKSLSVTEIETLVRDPYAIFARHVLGLDPLERVAAPPGAGERGSLIHAVLGGFAQRFPQGMPEDAEHALRAIAREAFAGIEATNPELFAEWWPRCERLMAAFLDWEDARRPAIAGIHAEVSGRWAIPMGTEPFTLRARADRIERRRDGSACIVDFKTGAPPTNPAVFAGFSPQLTLEAAMLMAGAFEGIPKPSGTPELLYVQASGGRKPLDPKPVSPPKGDARTVEGVVAEHAARLRGLVARYRTGEAAYVSRPYPQYIRYEGPYDHLARVREWSLSGEGEPEA